MLFFFFNEENGRRGDIDGAEDEGERTEGPGINFGRKIGFLPGTASSKVSSRPSPG